MLHTPAHMSLAASHERMPTLVYVGSATEIPTLLVRSEDGHPRRCHCPNEAKQRQANPDRCNLPRSDSDHCTPKRTSQAPLRDQLGSFLAIALVDLHTYSSSPHIASHPPHLPFLPACLSYKRQAHRANFPFPFPSSYYLKFSSPRKSGPARDFRSQIGRDAVP